MDIEEFREAIRNAASSAMAAFTPNPKLLGTSPEKLRVAGAFVPYPVSNALVEMFPKLRELGARKLLVYHKKKGGLAAGVLVSSGEDFWLEKHKGETLVCSKLSQQERKAVAGATSPSFWKAVRNTGLGQISTHESPIRHALLVKKNDVAGKIVAAHMPPPPLKKVSEVLSPQRAAILTQVLGALGAQAKFGKKLHHCVMTLPKPLEREVLQHLVLMHSGLFKLNSPSKRQPKEAPKKSARKRR